MSRSVRKNRIKMCGANSAKSYKKDHNSKERSNNKKALKNHIANLEEDCCEYIYDKSSIAWDSDKVYNYYRTWEDYRAKKQNWYERYGLGGPKGIKNPTQEQLTAYFWVRWRIDHSK